MNATKKIDRQSGRQDTHTTRGVNDPPYSGRRERLPGPRHRDSGPITAAQVHDLGRIVGSHEFSLARIRSSVKNLQNSAGGYTYEFTNSRKIIHILCIEVDRYD